MAFPCIDRIFFDNTNQHKVLRMCVFFQDSPKVEKHALGPSVLILLQRLSLLIGTETTLSAISVYNNK